MKKSALLFIILFIVNIAIMASGTNNPDDVIYKDIDKWRSIGLIDRLPPIRPYPAQYLISILEEVILKGDKKEIALAKKYLEKYTSTELSFKIAHNSFSNLDEVKFIEAFGIDGNFLLNEFVTGNIDINLYFLNSVSATVIPTNQSYNINYNADDANIDILNLTLYLYQGLDMNMGIGTDSFWFQSGIMQSSFGPLFDNSVVLNSEAYQAMHYSLTWKHELFTASYLFLPILATDNTGSNVTSGKYIHIRSLDFEFTKWWEFQFYETIVYGGNSIKPEYFLPFGEFFYTAGLSSTADANSLMGLSSRFQLPKNLSLTGTVYADDVHFNEMAKLNFNAKMKIAAQGELAWTPNDKFLKELKFNYTVVMPFMYTHQSNTDDDKWANEASDYTNYENYTNNGYSMGAYGMEPNSDKFGITIDFKLPLDFKASIHSEFKRHGNSSEGIESDSQIEKDGTIFDTGFNNVGEYLFQLANPFLNQLVIEGTFINQITLTSPSITFVKGELTGTTTFTHQYIENENLVKGNNNSSFFLSVNINYIF